MHRLILMLVLLVVAGCNSSSDTPHEHNSHGDFDQSYWPPSLAGIEQQQALPPTLTNRARRSLISAARSAVLNNPAVRDALGEAPTEFEASLGSVKSDKTAHFLFYRYDTDTTIEVTLQRGGDVQIESYDAIDYQPTENQDEINKAIELAQASLVSGGYDISDLNPTAMMTHPTATTMATAGQKFYPQRILYVTFGPGEGELPVYSAVVNLSNNTVTDGGPVR